MGVGFSFHAVWILEITSLTNALKTVYLVVLVVYYLTIVYTICYCAGRIQW